MDTHTNGHTPAAAPPVVAAKPSVRILAQYLKEFTFSSPQAPASLRASSDAPDLQLEVGIGHNKQSADAYEVTIIVKGTAVAKAGTIYDLNMTFGGVFEITGMRPEDVQPILFINAPALLFPFARQIVGEMTRAGGFAPVWLDPIDWGGLYSQRLAEAVRANAAPRAN